MPLNNICRIAQLLTANTSLKVCYLKKVIKLHRFELFRGCYWWAVIGRNFVSFNIYTFKTDCKINDGGKVQRKA